METLLSLFSKIFCPEDSFSKHLVDGWPFAILVAQTLTPHYDETSLARVLLLYSFHRVHAKGFVLCERACFCLLSAFQAPSITPPLLRTLLRTSVSIQTLTRHLLRSLLRSTSFKEPSKNPSRKHVAGVRPISGSRKLSPLCPVFKFPIAVLNLQEKYRKRSCLLEGIKLQGSSRRESRRRTNVQQLTCKMVWSFSFYSLFVSLN